MWNGDGLHYVRLGHEEAPAVLFLHGITESHRYFKRRVKPMARAWHLVLPDLPGFGHSPKPVVPYRIELFVDAVRKLVLRSGLADRDLHLVGHSLGAIIAVEYAGRYPERIDRLALLNLPRFSDPGSAHRIFWAGSASYRRLLREQSWRASLRTARRVGFVGAVRNAWGIPTEVLADCRLFTFQSLTSTLENCLLNYSVDAALDALPDRPTLLLHGARDQVAPIESIEAILPRHPHMRLHRFRSGGHHVLHTHPRGVLSLIREHLSAAS